MHRLTLILSDLYLPEAEAGSHGTPVQAVALPSLDWLLRFAHGERLPDDWRAWLARELGAPSLAGQPVAALRARGLPVAEPSNAWLATPVQLVARLDHVQLAARGILALAHDERETLRAEFAAAFGPPFSLHPVERGFVLAGLPAMSVRTVDPARLLGADIGESLPRGAGESAALRRLGAEIELWLHGSAFNEGRDRARAPRVSTLWLWGGGAPAARLPADAPPPLAARVAGGDPWIAALAGASRAAPRGFADLGNVAGHDVIELAPMSGAPGESLESLDAAWFAPARAALAAGTLDSLDVVANDRRFRIAARPSWRFWRRQRGWIESLRA